MSVCSAMGVQAWLTSGQLRGGHAFLVVTTTYLSWCFSHVWLTQLLPGSDQVSPGCEGTWVG